jgi:hypothetical protein
VRALRRAVVEWRRYLVLLAYAIVFVSVPVVLIDAVAHGSGRAVFTTLYFVALMSLWVAWVWRRDRRFRAHYTEMVAVSRRAGTASLMPDSRYLWRFLLWRVPIIAVLGALAFASRGFVVVLEPLIPLLIALAAISALVWHTDVPTLVATRDGLITRRYGLVVWSEITAVPVVQSRNTRALEIWVRGRVEIALRAIPARTRVGRGIAAFAQRRTGALTRIHEAAVLLDVGKYQRELQSLAGRSLQGTPAPGE